MAYHHKNSMVVPWKTTQKLNKFHQPNSLQLNNSKKMGWNNLVGKQRTALTQHFSSYDQNNRTPKIMKKWQFGQGNKNTIPEMNLIMEETNNSMKELLNSSLKQFQKLITYQLQGESLQQQNLRLKNSLFKLKGLLKNKLEIALQKQKDQLLKMLEEYTELINKLLLDKQQLMVYAQDIEYEYNNKLKKIIEERDAQTNSTKNQITDFLNVVQEYEEEATLDQNRLSEMQAKIMKLESQKQHLLRKIEINELKKNCNKMTSIPQTTENKSNRIQVLVQLLEKTSNQNNSLKAEMQQLRNRSINGLTEMKDIKGECQKKIKEMEERHEEEFVRYEETITDTLSKKDECIQRLNVIISKLRQRNTIF